MIRDKSANELSNCFEQLRWYLWGCREGGLGGWERRSEKPAEKLQPVASPPPVEEIRPVEEIPFPVCGTDSGSSRPVQETPPVEETRPVESASVAEELSRISEELNGCTRCKLHSGRTNLVFGEGSARSGLVFVGEGPGFDEDRLGRPFVGRAGKLLDKMIFALGLERSEVYICNVVKCRPPGNRAPEADEAAACKPFLFRQIDALAPKVLCALGQSAAQAVLETTQGISQLRGKVRLFRGIPLVCTYHPAYLLRSPSQKAAAWRDMKEVLKLLKG